MISHFRIKLTMTMAVFAMAVSFTLAMMDHLRLKEQAQHNKTEQVWKSEQTVKFALESMEKAYYVFGEHTAAKMRERTEWLLNKYENTPSFDDWDFGELEKESVFDIYIINDRNVITHSSLQEEVGLDFEACCSKLADILDERRKTGQFYHDGIDIEQSSGILKKYSYMATRDKQYMFQLGYSLKDSDIYKHFNFLHTIDDLVDQDRSINEINVLNLGGLTLGEIAEQSKLWGARRESFEYTLATGQTTEFRGIWGMEPAIYRYVIYDSEYDSGSTQSKVLEIIYNDKDLQALLKDNQSTFIAQLTVVLIATISLALLITRWVARPMYLAFHDSLTGLHNRAAFDELLESLLRDNKDTIALLMIDLDNFKSVNDDHGHDTGDLLLKRFAQSIRSIIRKGDTAVRLGGDEFVIIMPSTSKQEAEKMAIRLIKTARESMRKHSQLEHSNISVSIGIALAPQDGIDAETLCKQADKALYVSKEQGKNQYRFSPNQPVE